MSHAADTFALHERQQRLRELTEFTGNCRKQINDIYETLGWSADYEQEVMEQCPYDPAHRVPVRNMDKHKGSCRLTKMGYSAQEQEDLYDPSVCYENSSSVRSFHMDKSTQHQVILQARAAAPLMRMEGVFWQGQYSGQPVDVPQNHKRAVCDLTVADRLALYDHVAGVREKEDAASNNEDLYVDLVSKLQRDDGQNEPKTHLELMAEMRDYKRRRQSYRAKNVHITKKSYTEVIRDVINVHSEELTRQWRADEEEEEEVKKKKEDEEEKVKEEESTRSEHSSHRRRRSPSSESLVSRSRRRRERSQESEIKKKKREKKKERDSRSPCERKRKKKKKREEREKD